jgi:4-aminobutyrate aminotransferase-like enzyme
MLGFDLDPVMGSDAGMRLFKASLVEGLMIMGLANRVRINPPLIFSPIHVNEALDKLGAALKTLM